MPVSLEQWRASVGMINAGRSRVLAKSIKGSPRNGSSLDLILFLLVMAPLVMCCCVGAWLVVKWGGPVKHGQLLKRYRREDALRQCLLVGVVCCEGWLLSAHGEGVWPHETDKHPMTCLSESSNHLSTLSGCGQYLNVVFHTVMVTLLYLCGDVEKNPGPPFELVPSNLDNLYKLLSDVENDCYKLADGLRVIIGPSFQPEPGMRKIEALFREVLRIWLSRENPKPSWNELVSVLMHIRHVVLAASIMGMLKRPSVLGNPPSSSPYVPDTSGLSSFQHQPLSRVQVSGTATGGTAAAVEAGREPAGVRYAGHTKDILNLETIDESLLDRDGDFADVKEAVMHLAADWQKLAIHLLLRRNDIEVIRRNNLGDSQACLNDTMALWLEDNYNTARFGRPSWRALVKVVMKMDKALAQEIANQHRVRGLESVVDEEDAKKLFDEAMKEGHVTSQSVVIILNGIAGSGKSSFKRLVLNLDRAEKRVSTPLAEGAIRNISISRAIVNSDAVQWEVVESEALLAMVADAIKGKSSAKPLLVEKGDDSTLEPDDDVDYISDEEFDLEDDPILPLIRESIGSQRLLDVHWVYLIDTGGQPQFLQLLPAFIRNISSCACVCFVRLDQALDHKPMVEFFDKSGTQCGESYESEHTHLQVIESCVSTIHSKCGLNSEQPPSFLVVGTHLDEYERKNPHETIAMKNDRLITQLDLSPQQSLKLYKGEELIFPLNCKNPEERDQAVAAEFRKCIMKHCLEPASEIPLAWFVLEEHIRQYADQKKVAYIEKSTCLKLANKLEISRKAFEAALNHLLKLNIFRSYPSSPNLIFCDTHVVLLKLTELVQHGFGLRGGTICGLGSEDIAFVNEGVISVDYLSHFPQFFTGMFTAECFLKILCDLLAVADMDNGKYFMPCLLKQLSGTDFNKYRNSSKSLSTVLLYLDRGCLPNGLFTSLIASLKNNHQWALSKKNHKIACLYQNCVSFKIPKGSPGVVTLIASFNFIEVHLNCPFDSEIDKACISVFNDIRSGLQTSWETLYPGSISFKPAFFCTSCTTEGPSDICPADHYATVNDGGMFVTCSHDDSCVKKLLPSEVRWLKNANYFGVDGMETSGAHLQEATCHPLRVQEENSATSSEIMCYLDAYDLTSSPHLEKMLDWDNDGVKKDLYEIARHLTEWEVKLVAPLGLTPTEVSDIGVKYPREPELQRQALLRVWQSKNRLTATYKNLLGIFLKAGHAEGAKALCEVLGQKGLKLSVSTTE